MSLYKLHCITQPCPIPLHGCAGRVYTSDQISLAFMLLVVKNCSDAQIARASAAGMNGMKTGLGNLLLAVAPQIYRGGTVPRVVSEMRTGTGIRNGVTGIKTRTGRRAATGKQARSRSGAGAMSGVEVGIAIGTGIETGIGPRTEAGPMTATQTRSGIATRTGHWRASTRGIEAGIECIKGRTATGIVIVSVALSGCGVLSLLQGMP